ncbi:B12-binding domain-containing radical SAM protein [Candidatus Undinarchaeota archaeon]
MKIVLISLYNYGALGGRAIFSNLKTNGIDASLISFKDLSVNNIKPPTTTETKKLIELLKKLNPDIVGISFTSSYFKIATVLTHEIKRELNALVVWGGVHPTICPRECIAYADVVCIGEGEMPMLELAEKLSKNKRIDRIKNLWVNTRTGIRKNRIRPLIQDLDKLPLPVFDENNEYFIEDNKVYRGIPTKRATTYTMLTARGCPFQCSYCQNSSLRKIYPQGTKFVRRRSVDSVINEIIRAKKVFKEMRKCFFVDEVFAYDEKWIDEFLIKYKEKVNLPFEIEFYPTLVKESIVRKLKDAGLREAAMGIQSGSKRMLYDVYKRPTPQSSILNAEKYFQSMG